MQDNRLTDLSPLLGEILASFSTTASTCAEIFFSKPCSLTMPWRLTDDIDCDTDRIITIGYANVHYQAIAAIGVNNEDCFNLFNRTVHDDEFLDVYGELANNYCALLMDREEFTSRFGILHQSVPVLYSRGMPFLPFISGVYGQTFIDNGTIINFGSSIRKHSNCR